MLRDTTNKVQAKVLETLDEYFAKVQRNLDTTANKWKSQKSKKNKATYKIMYQAIK